MAEPGESLLKRCEEGHVFDVARHDTCPTCGSPVAGKGQTAGTAVPHETPSEAKEEVREAPGQAAAAPVPGGPAGPAAALRGWRGMALAGGVLGVALLVAAVLTTRDDRPPVPVTDATGAAEEEAPGPEVISPPAQESEPSPRLDDFNPSTADAYGLWEMYTPTATQGPFRHVIEIRPDSSYTVYAGPYSHAGTMTFAGRTYQLRSRTSAYQDAGAFFRPDPGSLVFEGRLGRSVWARVQEPALFDLSPDLGKIPDDMPGTLARMSEHIRATWRGDAVPVSFEIRRTQHGAHEIKVGFLSPQDSTGLSVTWSRFHSSEYAMGGVRWFDLPLPENFVDLPAAYEALGAVGPLKRVTLGYYNRGGGGNTFDRNAPPSWLILLESGQSGLVDARLR